MSLHKNLCVFQDLEAANSGRFPYAKLKTLYKFVTLYILQQLFFFFNKFINQFYYLGSSFLA